MNNASSTVKARSDMLRVLLNGPAGEADNLVAVKLADAGYADAVISRTLDGVSVVRWGGPTIQGIEYADDLQDFMYRRTWRYKIKAALLAFGSWSAGVASGIAIEASLRLFS